MLFSLDVRRARKGDCLLLHYGENKPGLVLIDGGPSRVYEPHLRRRLDEIRVARGIGKDDPLHVDLMMVSHIDDDHIRGLLELTDELMTAQRERRARFVRIHHCWHNSFDDIIGNKPNELLASVMAAHGLASVNGSFDPDQVDSDVFDHHSAMVLASVNQGRKLRDNLRALRIPVNQKFEGALVMANGSAPVEMGNGLKFTVIGPMKPELLALQQEHDRFLRNRDRNWAALAAFTDKSVANLSSQVVLAEVDGRSILLTGDARGDKILEGMEHVGLIRSGGKIHVDILKVPHHGSDRTLATEFFERVTADHYVFSGNGEHGNPERETFRMLLDARGDASYRVHLTYSVEEIDSKRERGPEGSLQSFLDRHPAFARKIEVVPADKRHVIDLHEPLGF